MNFHHEPKALGMAIAIAANLMCLPASADVTFTAQVPNGGTNLPGIVSFSVANDEHSFVTAPQELDFAAGVKGHQIAVGMRNALESSSSFDGNVSGKSLTIPDACEGEVDGSPAEYSISINIEPCLGDPIPPQDFDLSVERRSEDVLGLTLEGGPILAAGRVRVTTRIGSQTLTHDVPFNPSMTLPQLVEDIDAALAKQSSDLKYARYIGPKDGVLLYEVNTQRPKIPVGIGVEVDAGDEDSGLSVTVVHALADGATAAY
jgi:hypothetical protein